MELINKNDCQVLFYENFLNAQESELLFDFLKSTINWEQKQITFYEKTVNIPRLTAWISQTNTPYKYSKNPIQYSL